MQFDTGLGISLTLPEGATPLEDPAAGPLAREFGLSNGDVVSVVRDDDAAASLAGVIAWTGLMAEHYVHEFGAEEELQGKVASSGKQSFARTLSYKDGEGWARRATLIGTLLNGGAFTGITLLTINAGRPLDAALVQELVDGLATTS